MTVSASEIAYSSALNMLAVLEGLRIGPVLGLSARGGWKHVTQMNERMTPDNQIIAALPVYTLCTGWITTLGDNDINPSYVTEWLDVLVISVTEYM